MPIGELEKRARRLGPRQRGRGRCGHVRAKDTAKNVSLECQTAPLSGWQPVGTRYEYTRVDVQSHGAAVGGCSNGRHEMTSAGPFGVAVWGFDQYVSYAYPAGGSVKAVNDVVVPAVLQ